MMHDADDATLMQALRDADPLGPTVLDADARHRLERSWREASDVPAAESRTGRRTTWGHGRRLQLVAAVVAVVVVAAGGGVLSNVVARRGAGTPGAATTQPDAAAVEGSFRATVRHVGEPTIPVVTFDIVDGRVHARADTPQRVPAPWTGWHGSDDTFVDEQIISGDEAYLHARTGAQGVARWYRYTGSHARWQPRLDLEPPVRSEMTLPVFTEGTRGFGRVNDAEAAARGLTRYSADVATAELDFLGWFAPMRGEVVYERDERSIDIWVDTSGRVHRAREQSPDAPGYAVVMRFDQFDALRPIALPGEGDEMPAATDAFGIILVACGDAALGDALRERVREELDGDENVASYEIFDGSTPEADRLDVHDSNPLFVAVARFHDDTDDSEAGEISQRLSRLSEHDAGSSPDSIDGLASMCSVSTEPRIEFDG